MSSQHNMISTSFISDQFKYKSVLNTKYGLAELFDNLLLSSDIPFASFDNVSKIYKNTTTYVDSDWVSVEKVIRLKLLSRGEPTESTKYNDIDISFENNSVMLHGEIKERGLTKETIKYIDGIIKRCVGLKESDLLDKYNPHGEFYITNQTINVVLFLDMVMNNEAFNLLSVNERDQTLKSQSNIIYDDDNTTKLKRMTFVITPQIIEQELVVRILISTISNNFKFEYVDDFKVYIATIMKSYNENVIALRAVYMGLSKKFNTFLINLGNESWTSSITDQVIKSSKKIKAATEKQAARCQTIPDFFTTKDEALRDTDGDESKIFRFPKNDPDALWYSCNGKKNTATGKQSIWPGLTSRPPHIPCCYRTNQQTKRGGTVFKSYYDDTEIEKIEPKQKQQQKSKKYGKKLYKTEYGILPPAINEIFARFKLNKDQIFERYASDTTSKSLLHGIFDANKSIRIRRFPDPTTRSLSDNWYLASQELYDKDEVWIKDDISDPDVYLDPRYYTHLLEEIYDCTVFVFDENGLVIPRFKKGYYRLKNRNKPVILLYENKVGQTGELLCEQIILKTDKRVHSITYPPELIDYIFELFMSKTSIHNLDVSIPTYIDFLLPINWKAIIQSFDSYGKVRLVGLKKDNTGEQLIFYTSPLPVFKDCKVVPPGDQMLLYKNDPNVLDEFIHDTNTHVTSYINDGITELLLTFQQSGVYFKTRVDDDDKGSSDTDTSLSTNEDGLRVVTSGGSRLHDYKIGKRISNCVQEYIIWLYSKNSESHAGDINNFFKDHVHMINGYNYRMPSMQFSEDNNGVMVNKKLIVNSPVMLERLKYYLKFRIQRNPDIINLYKNTPGMLNYYDNIDNYKTSDSFSMYKGTRFIEFTRSVYNENVTTEIKEASNVPYYFSNKLLGTTDVFLALTTGLSIEKTKTMAIEWRDNILKDQQEPVSVFLFINKNTIKPMHQTTTVGKINIIASKILNNEILFTLLTKL